jgi:fructosamine-3-kinase
VLDADWLFTRLLAGTALPALTAGVDDAGARYDAGVAIARAHRLTGDRYGYTGDRAHGATWRLAFIAIMDELLSDAVAWGVTLPVPAECLRDVLARHAPVLDIVERPALLHFDLWDGNLLAAVDGTGATRLTGLVDGERHLYGDCLLDLVSPCLFRRIEDEPGHPFLRGYVAESGEPFLAEETVRIRLALYRLHLYLIMLVEIPSRGMTEAYGNARRARIEPLFQQEVTRLEYTQPATT